MDSIGWCSSLCFLASFSSLHALHCSLDHWVQDTWQATWTQKHPSKPLIYKISDFPALVLATDRLWFLPSRSKYSTLADWSAAWLWDASAAGIMFCWRGSQVRPIFIHKYIHIYVYILNNVSYLRLLILVMASMANGIIGPKQLWTVYIHRKPPIFWVRCCYKCYRLSGTAQWPQHQSLPWVGAGKIKQPQKKCLDFQRQFICRRG